MEMAGANLPHRKSGWESACDTWELGPWRRIFDIAKRMYDCALRISGILLGSLPESAGLEYINIAQRLTLAERRGKERVTELYLDVQNRYKFTASRMCIASACIRLAAGASDLAVGHRACRP
jgi:hypothetical protein